MIQVEMLSSPDINRKGLFSFHRNKILIGTSLAEELVLSPLNKSGDRFSLEVEADGSAYIYPDHVESFLVNGNKTNAKKKVFINDIVEYAGNRFKIVLMQYEAEFDLGGYLNDQLEKLKAEKSPFLKVLKALKE
jgi:hypothetical protein